ncbi:MAG: O-antigen ligase family protein [Acidobacteria bacterium]|nr:O-antigen ligase family protein [Acidobacteriota bacterium]
MTSSTPETALESGMDLPDHTSRPTRFSRMTIVLYLFSLALLPWMWFPPFPWLHRHAQWGDVVFAAAAVAWAWDGWQTRKWPRANSAFIALSAYFLFAALSLFMAAPITAAGIWKLVGIGELCALCLITSDLSTRPEVSRFISPVIAVTSLLTAAAALVGLALFYAGVLTPLIGSYGDLLPSHWYARVQAGTYNPNLLASYCIFASAVIARDLEKVPSWWRRCAIVGLWATVLLTFSRGILGFLLAAVIRRARTSRQRKLTALLAGAFIAIITALTFWNISLDPIRPIEARLVTDTQTVRWQALTSSLRALAEHPLLGTGLGTSPGRITEGGGQRAEGSMPIENVPVDAHFTPVNIAATMGIPALAAFIGLIVIIWRSRSKPTDLAIWSGLAGLGLDALGQDIEDFRHVWVMLGLAVDGKSRQRAVGGGQYEPVGPDAR